MEQGESDAWILDGYCGRSVFTYQLTNKHDKILSLWAEIPQGLELIGKGVEQDMTSRSRRFSMRRIVMASLLRIVIGYMFLICLFLVVVQEATVLDIFFDVLALQFVENIDDVIYELCKRGKAVRSLL